MDHPEGLGSASASEVPARPPGPGYNFRPRSRSATAPKNRRLGSVETPGAGSTLDLPNITPPNSPTPRGAGIPTHENIRTIISHNLTTGSSTPFSQLMPDTVAAGISLPFPLSTLMPNPIVAGVSADNLQIPDTRTGGVGSAYSTLVPLDSTPSSSLPNSTLVPTNGTEDPLPVPVDDRPILHNMSAKNKTKTFAGENNMATTRDNDVDNSTKLPQANPLLGLVLETRPIISDVTADNRPEQPLGFKAARDRLDGNESYMVVNHAQNATLVAAKTVCLDTPDFGRTAQWITDNQSTALPPNPGRTRYTSGSSSSDSSLSPPAMTVHQLGSQPQPRRKPPSSRSSRHSSASRQSVDFFALTNRLADTTDNAIQRLLEAQQIQSQQQMTQSQQLLEAQQIQSQQQMAQSQHLVDAQQLQVRQQAEAQKQHLDTMQGSIHLHAELAVAQERLKQMQEIADLKAQLACQQQSKSSSADIQPNTSAEIQGAQKISKTQVTTLGHQTDFNFSVTPSMSTNAKQSVCSASHNLAIIAEDEINRVSDSG